MVPGPRATLKAVWCKDRKGMAGHSSAGRGGGHQGRLRAVGGGRWLALACATVYLSAVWLDAAGEHRLEHVLPAPLRFFTQVAELFPRAADDVIEWHVKGFRCDVRQFDEIDVRPFFPIHRDDKESRFYRTMFFYYRERPVLAALDDYITREHNRQHPDERIGGVMLLSLRIPLPALGAKGERYHWHPIAEAPATLTRRYWHTTAPALRDRRCAEAP